jgi:SAM-dependent methyltransferase
MSAVIWHDLECGRYEADLPLWRGLAEERAGPVLDIGAGTGRVTLDLARRGHAVTALEREADLLAELRRRANGLPVVAALADARSFSLSQRFALCVVPMQTVQLLGGSRGRRAFLSRARRHLEPGGVIAAAIVSCLETFELRPGHLSPLPDVGEYDGTVYWSQPTAVRRARHGYVLERRREIVARDGTRAVSHDTVHLEALDAAGLERDGRAAGLHPLGRDRIDAVADYAGSEIVMLGA